VGFLDHFRSIFTSPVGRRSAVPATAPDDTPDERRRRQRRNPKEGTTILLIDDSPTILTALKRILRSAGCVTLEAPDAEQGLEIAARQTPHLIFLDIVLPGMNGFAALRQLRRDPATRDIPVIMMSGNEQATEQFFGTRIGADDFMKKPFSRFEVFARIERLLDETDVPRRLPRPDEPAPVSRSAALQSS
jgi:twitching motility two-component system response regulator PilH